MPTAVGRAALGVLLFGGAELVGALGEGVPEMLEERL
jgi:hypothetical protein